MRTEPLKLAFRHTRTTCNQIARAARRIAPENTTGWRRPGPHLNRTITATTRITGPTQIRGDVGSELRHALVAHNGARPHPIFPRSSGGTLRFFWSRKGRWVRLSGVNHPGMDGVPYLTTPLLFIGTARGYKIIIS
jgi:hypothetical protein